MGIKCAITRKIRSCSKPTQKGPNPKLLMAARERIFINGSKFMFDMNGNFISSFHRLRRIQVLLFLKRFHEIFPFSVENSPTLLSY